MYVSWSLTYAQPITFSMTYANIEFVTMHTKCTCSICALLSSSLPQPSQLHASELHLETNEESLVIPDDIQDHTCQYLDDGFNYILLQKILYFWMSLPLHCNMLPPVTKLELE